MSMAMPSSVLMSEIQSAPSSSTLLAIDAISVTFGDSFTVSGREVWRRTNRVTPAADSHVAPKAMPPCLTLGHEILTSNILTSGTPSRRRASSEYSSAVLPEMLTITGTPFSRKKGSSSAINPSTPGFSRPMEFSNPAGVSTSRRPALPWRGLSVMPLTTTAPSNRKS